MIQIEHDDDGLAIIEKVNSELEKLGLQFEDDDKEHDGYMIYILKETK